MIPTPEELEQGKCSVQSCKQNATHVMYWPNGKSIDICDEHTDYYASIIGNHMRIEATT